MTNNKAPVTVGANEDMYQFAQSIFRIMKNCDFAGIEFTGSKLYPGSSDVKLIFMTKEDQFPIVVFEGVRDAMIGEIVEKVEGKKDKSPLIIGQRGEA